MKQRQLVHILAVVRFVVLAPFVAAITVVVVVVVTSAKEVMFSSALVCQFVW